ncbi:hypothetical protein [Symbiobacterium terraclitae]|uniref:hypothetical protein n=1 Tax=Symbiobacterium terraclitae TaxID=557451 RepID=UPI0035B512F4
MSPEQTTLYGILAVVVITLVIMLVGAPEVVVVVDWLVTRGALVAGVYLFWRLVRALENRGRSEDGRTDSNG